VESATPLPPGETKNSDRSLSSVWVMRTPTELKAVTTPSCGFPLNFGTLTGIAKDAAGLGAVLSGAGPSGMTVAVFTHWTNWDAFFLAPAIEGIASSQNDTQAVQANTSRCAQRFLIIGLPFPYPWLFR
jgi:hypothetical protein